MKRFLLPKHLLLSASAACILAGPIGAFAGSPRVTSVYPAGGQRGADNELDCKGSNLEDATGALFDEPGFEVSAVKIEKGRFRMKVKIAPNVRLGEHTFRVTTASGVSDVRLFYVTPYPMVEEIEAPAATAKVPLPATAPQPIALGTTVFGHTPNEDQDRFEVEAKKGQRISAEVIGARLQTQQIYDPMVTITKADGTRLGEADDTAFTRQDPVISIIAPEDGKYVVMIKEATNVGVGECEYLLNIGSFPRPLSVYPAGGPAGEELKVTLIGDAGGSIEKKIKLPAKPDDHFEVYSEADGQATPQPNFIRVSNLANVLEAEPNNDIATATGTDMSLPLALNGIIGEKNDSDFFKIHALKGQVFDVKVWARRVRSPLDSVLAILDAKGNQVAFNDDDGQLDSGVRWTAGADGDYFVRIEDKLHRGGPLFTYRVELTPVKAKVDVWLPEMVQNSNQERRAIVVPKGNRYASLVRLKRNDTGGNLGLEAHALPAGISITGTDVDKSVDTVPMVFEATADAASSVGVFDLEAKLTEAKDGATVESRVANDIDVAENGNQKSFYSVKEDRLVVAVTEAIPVKLNLIQPKVPVLQNGSMNLKVVAERTGDFKGPISLALLYSPPGIGTAGTVQVPDGQTEANVAVSANGNAPLQKWKVCVVGSADFGKGAVWFSSALAEIEVGAPFFSGQIQRSFVDQGETTTISVKLENKIPFEGKAKLSLLGLPPNTTAEEVEISAEDKVAKFTVKAGANAPVASHKQLFCQFQLVKDGETMTNSFANGGILRVDKAAAPAAAQASK